MMESNAMCMATQCSRRPFSSNCHASHNHSTLFVRAVKKVVNSSKTVPIRPSTTCLCRPICSSSCVEWKSCVWSSCLNIPMMCNESLWKWTITQLLNSGHSFQMWDALSEWEMHGFARDSIWFTMVKSMFPTQVCQKAGLRHAPKALLRSFVKLCTKCYAM